MQASDSENRPSSRIAALALCLAMVGAVSMLYYHLGLFLPRTLEASAARGLGNGYAFGNDFYPIWLTARKWRFEHYEHRDLYSPEMTREIQTGLFGRPLDAHIPTDPPADYREFAYPAFTELVLWPAALFDFPTLRLVLAVLLLVLTVGSVWFWMLALQWRIRPLWFVVLVVLTLCNYPVLEALFAEQPGLIVSFLLAGGMLALRHQRLSLAGVLLSLTLIKPQMTLLAIVYLLLWSFADRRRIRFCIGFLATTLLMMITSLWIWPHWVGQWIRVLLGYHRYATPPLLTLLPGTTLGPYVGPVAIVALLGLAATLAWRYRRVSSESPQFWLTLSLLLAVTSITILPGQAVYDHVILIPGIFLLVCYWRELRAAGLIPRTLLVLGAAILSWQWVAAFAVMMIRPWLSSEQFDSAGILSLPIRTAASLPFAVLALLACAQRLSLAENQEPS